MCFLKRLLYIRKEQWRREQKLNPYRTGVGISQAPTAEQLQPLSSPLQHHQDSLLPLLFLRPRPTIFFQRRRRSSATASRPTFPPVTAYLIFTAGLKNSTPSLQLFMFNCLFFSLYIERRKQTERLVSIGLLVWYLLF